MLQALVFFVIAAIIIAAVGYILILLVDWVAGTLGGMPPLLWQIIKVMIVVICVVAILYQLVPLVGRVT